MSISSLSSELQCTLNISGICVLTSHFPSWRYILYPLLWFWFELFTLPELGCLKQEKLSELKYEHYILSVNSQCCDVLIICFLLLLSSSDVITPRLHQGCWGGVCLTGVQRCKGIAILKKKKQKKNCGNVITWSFITLRTAASCCFQNLLMCWSLNWFCL